MPVYFNKCNGGRARCNCEVALVLRNVPDEIALVGRCPSSSMCKNSFVKNIFDENSCNSPFNNLQSVLQAFNQTFWNDAIRQRTRTSRWLDCAKFGKNEYFVYLNVLFRIISNRRPRINLSNNCPM
jgi:hypothetical protein